VEELPHWPYNVLVFVTVSLHAQHISPFPGPAHTRGMLSFGNRPLASLARMRRIRASASMAALLRFQSSWRSKPDFPKAGVRGK
jgi:hypothetical protein